MSEEARRKLKRVLSPVADKVLRCDHCVIKTLRKDDACLAGYTVEEQRRGRDGFDEAIPTATRTSASSDAARSPGARPGV
jgi:hypothetical protein